MKKIISLVVGLTLLFTACVSEQEGKEGKGEIEFAYDIDFESEGTAIEDARLQYGLSSTTAFPGILNLLWYESNPDAVVMQFLFDSLYYANKSREFVEGKEGELMAWYEMNEASDTKTIHVKEGVKWHDGEEFTVDDIIFGMNVHAHPNYDGVRFYGPITMIEGVEEYRANATANSVEMITENGIAGIQKVNDYEMTIKYVEPMSDYLYNQETYLPEHIFGSMKVADMSKSAAVRQNPIGTGPFKLVGMVPGEAVTYDRFDDYHLGKPKIAGVDLKVVNPDVVNQALKSGDLDMVSTYSTSGFEESNLGKNVHILQNLAASYNYVGFKLGKWDKSVNKNVVNPNAKTADVELRRAIAYSSNNAGVAKGLYDGLRTAANSIIVPTFAKFYNKDFEGYTYDIEKAKSILDEAGYKDTDGDGYVENKDGSKLVLNAIFMAGAGSEEFANTYLQGWKEAGINVQLLDGRLHEFNSFYDQVGADNPDIDIFSGAWSTGYDPNPTGLYGEESQFNYTRYTDEDINKVLADINDVRTITDEEFKLQAYRDWEQVVFDKAHVIPSLYRTVLLPVNKRVKAYSLQYGSLESDGVVPWHKVELIEDKPVVD